MGRGKKDRNRGQTRELEQEKSTGKAKLQLPKGQSAHGAQESPCEYNCIFGKSRVSGL